MIIVPLVSFAVGLFLGWLKPSSTRYFGLFSDFKKPLKYNMDEYSEGFEDGFNLAEKIYQDQYSDRQ
jgi:hypothetical protein